MFTILALTLAATAALPHWTFDDPADLETWKPNSFLANVEVKDGVLHAEAIDWDPFFTGGGLDIPATPWQYVVLRIKADKSGNGELFWTGATEGRYGGFDPGKSTPFKVIGDGQFHEVAIIPFWHPEGTIRQLRLDLYDGARFEIDSIEVKAWGEGSEPASSSYEWQFESGELPWTTLPGTSDRFTPPLDLSVEGREWVSVSLTSDTAGTATLLWAGKDVRGIQMQDFAVRAGAAPRTYNLEMNNMPGWDRLVSLGIRLPGGGRTVLHSIAITDAPRGPADVEVTYLGFENAINRALQERTLLVQLTNRGGAPAEGLKVALSAPRDVNFFESPEKNVPRLDYGEQANLTWRVMASEPRAYAVTCTVSGGEGAAEPVTTELAFLPPHETQRAEYVPEPRPVQTSAEVWAYYFPGWESDAKWDCIRRIAPIRKPLLGYYDESNPECVDWQIKWALENGISAFLVDWYWVKGSQHLTHWFEAYRQARYRDQLKVAIMWANHNPPGSHSFEDWRNVTREWIDRYFNLPGYLRVDGKPVVFLWDPNLIRNDLGGPEAVAKAFAESQTMAQAAGYDGVTFVSMHPPRSEAQVKTLKEEGYYGLTTYHEWGEAGNLAPDAKHWSYEDLVRTVPGAWREQRSLADAAGLVHYPVADTGWDARPWHGDKSHMIEGRTAERFERLLRDAKAFTANDPRPVVILAPLNEWGEGSYIEPATEYGFTMYEAIRNVFGLGDPAGWPLNLSPADVGRGPYDYPDVPLVTSWTFDAEPVGWHPMMSVSEPVCEDGMLKFRTLSKDPALVVETPRLEAKGHPKLEIRMRLTGNVEKGNFGQLFWSRGGYATSEAASVRFPLADDGEMHTYTIDLAANPRWRGSISMLRFDPCETADTEVAIDKITLLAE